MLYAKYEYSTAIETKKRASKEQFADELNNALLNKDFKSLR